MREGGVLTEKTHLHLSLCTAERLGPDCRLETTSTLVTQREVNQEKEEQVSATGARIQSPLDAVNQIMSPSA